MQKQAPTLGRMLVMVGFALSCFGLLLFLWLAFGGPIPLKPKGYQFKVSFGEGTQLAVEADVRISGVPVGKVKTVEPNPETGRSLAVDPDRGALRAALQGHQGDPAPEDAARRDLRRADAGQPAPRGHAARERHAADRRRSRRPSSSTRSSARSTPRRGARSRPGCRSSRAPLDGPRAATSTTRSATSSRSPRTPTSCSRSSTRRRARSARSCATPASCSTRSASAAASCRALITQLQPRLHDDGRSATRSCSELFRVLPTFNREARTTVDRLTRVRARHRPARHPAAARPRASSARRSSELELLAPDLKALFRDLDPLITASEKGLPALRAVPARPAPGARRVRPAAQAAQPDPQLPRQLPRRAARASSPTSPAATQATTPDGVHYLRTTEPAEPREPRRLSAPDRLEPDEPVPEAAAATDDIGRGGLQALRDAPLRQRQPGDRAGRRARQPARGRHPVPAERRPPARRTRSAAAADADTLAGNILSFVFANAGRDVPAPPCATRGRSPSTRAASRPRARRRSTRTCARRRRSTSAAAPALAPMPERLRRIVAFAAAPPGAGPCWSRSLLALAGGAARAAAASRARRTDTLVGKGSDSYEATAALLRALRRRRGLHARPGRPDQARPDLRPRAAARARGLRVGQRAGRTSTPRGGRDGPCARLGRDQAGARSSSAPARSSTSRCASCRPSSSSRTATRRRARTARREAAEQLALQARAQRGRGQASSAPQARELVNAEFTRNIVQLALQYGLRAEPRLDDPNFVSRARLRRGQAAPGRRRASSPTCSRTSSRRSSRCGSSPGSSQDEREDAITQIRRAVAMPDWKLENGGTYVVTGAPVVVNDLADAIQELDPAAARRRAARHGGDARARVPRAPAAAAAGDRARPRRR